MEFQERQKTYQQYRFIDKENVKLSKLLKYVGRKQIKVKDRNLFEDNVILRGDLASVSSEKGVILCENVIIHPSLNNVNAAYEFKPINIGKFSFIGKNSIISSLRIGDYVYIGENCILSDRTKVADNVKIMDNTFVPSDMELVEFGIYEGYPAKLVGYLDNQNSKYMEFFCNEYFEKLVITQV